MSVYFQSPSKEPVMLRVHHSQSYTCPEFGHADLSILNRKCAHNLILFGSVPRCCCAHTPHSSGRISLRRDSNKYDRTPALHMVKVKLQLMCQVELTLCARLAAWQPRTGQEAHNCTSPLMLAMPFARLDAWVTDTAARAFTASVLTSSFTRLCTRWTWSRMTPIESARRTLMEGVMTYCKRQW